MKTQFKDYVLDDEIESIDFRQLTSWLGFKELDHPERWMILRKDKQR